MTAVYLGTRDLARLAGISPATANSYYKKGLLPEPAVLIGEEGGHQARGWTREQVEEWIANRPGQGARTDLTK